MGVPPLTAILCALEYHVESSEPMYAAYEYCVYARRPDAVIRICPSQEQKPLHKYPRAWERTCDQPLNVTLWRPSIVVKGP